MYKYMLLAILSLGVHSHFVPLKITSPPCQQKDIHTIVREIVCLLNKISENFEGNFTTPVNITCQKCSHEYIDTFIEELHKKVPQCPSVLLDVKELKKCCSFLKKNDTKNHQHCETMERDFSTFKEKLETFVCWINQENLCNTTQENGRRLRISPQYSCADEKNYYSYHFGRKESCNCGEEGKIVSNWSPH